MRTTVSTARQKSMARHGAEGEDEHVGDADDERGDETSRFSSRPRRKNRDHTSASRLVTGSAWVVDASEMRQAR
jgi:hypothetical protein